MQVLDRRTQMVGGIVFLGLMMLFLVLAISTFEGTPTVLFIVASVVCLGVGLFFLTPPGSDEGSSQQQSVVLGNGQVVRQGGSILRACISCGGRIQETFAHCPHCGVSQA